MSNNYTFYDLNKCSLPEWEGLLSAEKYSTEVWGYIEENKEKINKIVEWNIKWVNTMIKYRKMLDENKEYDELRLKKDYNQSILENKKEFLWSDPIVITSYIHKSIWETGETFYKKGSENYIKAVKLFLEILLKLSINWWKWKEEILDCFIALYHFLYEETKYKDHKEIIFIEALDLSELYSIIEDFRSNNIYDIKNDETLNNIFFVLFNLFNKKIESSSESELNLFFDTLELKSLKEIRELIIVFSNLGDRFNNDLIIERLMLLYKEKWSNNKIDIYKESLKVIIETYDLSVEDADKFMFIMLDKKMWNKIISIFTSEIPNEYKKSIFEKYINLIKEVNISIDEQVDKIEWLDRDQLFKEFVNKVNDIFIWVDKILDDDDPDNYEEDLKEIEVLLNNTKQEYIESGIFFKNLKDKNITNLDDLEKIWIDHKKVKLFEMNWLEKSKIKEDLIKLYYDNYDSEEQWNFLKEIESWLDNMLKWSNEVEFYMFYVDWNPVLSSYFKKEENWELYWWWFNWKDNFQEYGFWFWIFEKLLEEKKDENINWIVFKKVEWKKNRYKSLLRIYEKYWFLQYWNWNMDNASFIKMTNNISTKKEVS